MNELSVVSFFGWAVMAGCAVIGAYVLGRWGFCGVLIIWQRRAGLDRAVAAEITGTIPELDSRAPGVPDELEYQDWASKLIIEGE